MKLPHSKEPFRFFSRLSLAAATGVRARDLRELLDGIRSVPDSVLHAHTYRFLQQHQFLAPEPMNDFAVWASEALQDEVAGERLMAVDPSRYDTIKDLRAALSQALEDHLKQNPPPRSAPAGEEFHFTRSIRFSLPTPIQAFDLAEFRDALKKISASSLHLHLFEARLRPPLGRNDFSAWLEGQLGEKGLAKKIARLEPSTHSHEELRKIIIAMVENRLEALNRG